MNIEKSQNNNTEQGDVARIGPTAWATAHRRVLAEIPFAQEVFEELETSINSANENEKDYFNKAKESNNTTVQIEARFRMINHLLEEQLPKQILEIASGLSSRGMFMAKEHKYLKYAELDLPEVMSEKQKIVEKLKTKLGFDFQNLDLRPGDALNYDSIIKAINNFNKEEITVVNEGLLRYLTFEQKTEVANNIHKLLEEYGGRWITPDITLRKVILAGSNGKEYERISKLSGINIDTNSFESEEHAKTFFEELGFSVEPRHLVEIENELVSPNKVGINREEAHNAIKDMVVFVMKAKRI